MSETITSPKIAWSVLEVSQATGLSAPFLRREIKRGVLPTKRFGRRVLILDSALQAYLSKGSEGNKQRG
ncbi:MAG: helix-turn-helix domain-containing protein [Acidobacteria bacterium]|nr:helix-turn-helix domain-containing protein [Acidobacteriota bacterium]